MVKRVLKTKKNTEKTLIAILLAFCSSPVNAKFSQMISSGSSIGSISSSLPNSSCYCLSSLDAPPMQEFIHPTGDALSYMSRTTFLVSQCLKTTKMYWISLIFWLLGTLVTVRLFGSLGTFCCTSCLYLTSNLFCFSKRTFSSSYLSGMTSSL